MKRTHAVLTVGFLLVGTTTCSKSPTGLEVLPETLATVQAAVDLFTTGSLYVAANCGGTTTVNCPGGTPGGPVPVTETRDSVHIVQSPDTTVYYVTAWVALVTPHDIPISFFGTDCGVAINSAPGVSPNVAITATAHFTSQTAGGPINRIDFSNVTLSGLETGDVTLSGASLLCTIGNFGLGFFVQTLQAALAQYPAYCGAPGAKLLEPCPPQAVAAQTITGVAAGARVHTLKRVLGEPLRSRAATRFL